MTSNLFYICLLCCIGIRNVIGGNCNDYNATQKFIDLEVSLDGEIIYPSDPTHSELNNVENPYYDSIMTDSIIYVESEQDVVKTVQFFRKNKECTGTDSTPFRIRSGGHNYGGYSICEDCIIIDVSRLNHISFNSDDNTYSFGAGVIMDDLIDTFRTYQRIIPSGAAATVSISGYIDWVEVLQSMQDQLV